MSATEQLRKMLDERGVSHVDNHPEITGWWGDNDIFWVATEIYDDVLDLDTNMTNFTPAQVIAATVTQDSFIHESGMNEQTCTVESMHGFTDAHVSTRYFVELSCHTIDDWGDSEPPEFCPYCGRKVGE